MTTHQKIYIEDFGILPDDGQDVVPALRKAVAAANQYEGMCEIVFQNGRYDAFARSLSALDINVSNTHSEQEDNHIRRNFAVLLKNTSDICLNGNGCTIAVHGKMTLLGAIDSRNICMKSIHFHTVHPTLKEMMVIAQGEGYIDCRVHPDSLYRIRNKKIEWYGENYSFSCGISQLYDPETGLTWREYSPLQDENAVFDELSSGIIRIRYSQAGKENPYGARVGYIFQMRDPLRDECGILVSGTDRFTIKNTTVDYMHGMGLIVQNSSDIYIDGFNAVPSGSRTASCFADVMHFSGCRGEITIENGCYIGAHDDAINVHGTHLEVIRQDGNSIMVRFVHPQTRGIGGFLVGDTVSAVNPDTLLHLGDAQVKSVRELSSRELLLEIDGDSTRFTVGAVVENVSAIPAVKVKNNYFERIPTRGILVTTSKSVIIENNCFYKIKGCGILIADDAKSWYESGNATDVMVCGNTFRLSGGPFMRIKPENISYEGAVHKNITVIDNDIYFQSNADKAYSMINRWTEKKNNSIFEAGSTDNITFSDNRIYGEESECTAAFEHCRNVKMQNNSFAGKITVNTLT